MLEGKGVIVYEVLNPDADPNVTRPLIKLGTPTALTSGQVFTSSSGVTVQVTSAPADGFSISIDDPTRLPQATVPDIFNECHSAALVEVPRRRA